MISDRLLGKVIVLAGAGGIGNEVARRYASEGAAVVLGDVNSDLARKVASEIQAAGGQAHGLELDGASEASVRAAIDCAVTQFGGLDGFHANYSAFDEADGANDVTSLPMGSYDRIMDTNARGFVICTQLAVPALLERGGGCMVYTSSGAAYIGEPVRLAYAMSKAAIHALARHVANRFGPDGIRANVICPGVIVHENLLAFMTPEMEDAFREGTALKNRLGKPQDIAAMAALLMSDEGSFITGQAISVDGGTIMHP
ncbi:MAG: SDR family NAD(P)-dependent oxidoreductase [Novosphingobium sp.]